MKVDNEVLAVLAHAVTNGNSMTLVGQLDRNLYTKTDKVLKAAGGKWNSKAKTHLFAGDAADAMEQIILTGQVTVPQDFGYFPTPAPLVKRLVQIADIADRMTVLEPSAGTGNIVAGLHAAGASVDAIELLEKNIEALKKQGLATLIGVGDFLETPAQPVYDRVVMNPPFAKQADIKHVTHALAFVKPGGRLVSIMSANVTFRDNKLTTDFREKVKAHGGWFETVEEGAFKSSGTMVNTVIVVIPKPASASV